MANIAATLNRGDYDGALRRMALSVKQRQNGRLVTVPGLVNRRAAEAGLWACEEFMASRHVAPAAPPSEGAEAAKLGGYATAPATAAPALQALAGVPVVMLSVLVLLSGCGAGISERPCPRVTEFPVKLQRQAGAERDTAPALARMIDAMAADRAFNRVICP